MASRRWVDDAGAVAMRWTATAVPSPTAKGEGSGGGIIIRAAGHIPVVALRLEVGEVLAMMAREESDVEVGETMTLGGLEGGAGWVQDWGSASLSLSLSLGPRSTSPLRARLGAGWPHV